MWDQIKDRFENTSKMSANPEYQCECGAVPFDGEECQCDVCPKCGEGQWEMECVCEGHCYTCGHGSYGTVCTCAPVAAPVPEPPALKPYQCPGCTKIFMDVKGHIKRGKCKGPPKPKPAPKPIGRPRKATAPVTPPPEEAHAMATQVAGPGGTAEEKAAFVDYLAADTYFMNIMLYGDPMGPKTGC